MIQLLWKAAASLFHVSSLLIIHSSQALLALALFLSAAYYFGWIHRLAIFILESEASKIINHTPVTIGSVQFDILRGHAWISNIIIHSPRREQWQWESPVLARIGRVYVESNVLAIVFRFWFMGEEIPIDVHSVTLSDIQVFVERKQELFNFYLLDPHVQVPEIIVAGLNERGSDRTNDELQQRQQSSNAPALQQQPEQSYDPNALIDEGVTSTNTSLQVSSSDEQAKAQKLVDGMLRSLGRAAQNGTIQNALMESRLSITSHLKALQKSNKKSEVMQEGVKIVQQVSKQFVEKERMLHQVVQPHRTTRVSQDKIVYGRFGRIILQDARVFTRENIHHLNDVSYKGVDHEEKLDSCSDHSASSWGKPIYLKQVIFRAAELCPSMSCKDAADGTFPAVFQPLDRIIETVQIRLLSEVAKSNTGRVFQTALGEMLDYWIEKSKQEVTSTASEVNSY
jgi:hypothetical protein